MWTSARSVMAGCYGLTGVLNALWGATLAATDARLDLGTGRLGVVLLVLGLGALSAMPVAGLLAERLTTRRLLRWVAPLFAVSLAGPAAADSFASLMAAVLALSVLLGLLNVALTVQAVDLERSEGRPVMATLHGVWALGALAGGTLTGVALRAGADVRSIMVVGAVTVAVTAVFLGRALPAPAPVEIPAAGGPAVTGGEPPAPTVRFALILALGLIGAAAFLTEGAATDWSGVYAHRVLGADPATASLAYTVFFAAMTGVRLLGDALRSRVGPGRVVLLAGLTATAGYGVVLLSPALGRLAVPATLTGWALAGAGMALIWPIVSSTVGAAFPGQARSLSVVTTLSYGGGLIGPALIGWVASHASLPVAMVIPAGLVAVVTIVAPRVLAALPTGRTSTPESAPAS